MKKYLFVSALCVLTVLTSCKKEEVTLVSYDVTGTSWTDAQATKDISAKITLSINFDTDGKISGTMKAALQTVPPSLPSLLSGTWLQANTVSKTVTLTVVEGTTTWQGTGTINDDNTQMAGTLTAGRSSIQFNLTKK